MDNGSIRPLELNRPAAQQIIAAGIKCVVSKRVTQQGQPIRYAVKDNPLEQTDSGWTFLSGEELDYDDHYLESDANFQMYELNTVVNVDATIIPLLGAPMGAAFERENRQSQWQQVTDIPPNGPVIDPYLYRPPAN